MTFTVAWRLDDPAEAMLKNASPYRWTRVHLVESETRHDSDTKTFCGIKVPDFPYDTRFDEQTTCARCLKAQRVREIEARRKAADYK